jgi:hypothetical protein
MHQASESRVRFNKESFRAESAGLVRDKGDSTDADAATLLPPLPRDTLTGIR